MARDSGLLTEPPAAKERQAEGQKSGGRGKKKLGGKLPPSLAKTRDRLAKVFKPILRCVPARSVRAGVLSPRGCFQSHPRGCRFCLQLRTEGAHNHD